MAEDTRQDVYHHYDNDGARINASFEVNSRGVNYSATVTGASSVGEAILLLKQAQDALKALFENKELSKVEIEEKKKEK